MALRRARALHQRSVLLVFFTFATASALALTLTPLDCTVVAGETGLHDSSDAHLDSPRSLSVDGQGDLFIADYHNDRVMKWVDGAASGVKVAGSSAVPLSHASKVFVTREGFVLVAEAVSSPPFRITLWKDGSYQGDYVADHGSRPFGMAQDTDGSLLVASFGGDAPVKRYPPWNGSSVTGVDWLGGPAGHYMNVAVGSDGRMYGMGRDFGVYQHAAEQQDLRLGQLIAGVAYGKHLNEMGNPRGLAVDSRNFVWVADFFNNRVLRCTSTDPNDSCDAMLTGVIWPMDVAFSPSGSHFYVVQRGRHNILKCPKLDPPTSTSTTTTSSSSSTSSSLSSTTSSLSSTTSNSITNTATSTSTSGEAATAAELLTLVANLSASLLQQLSVLGPESDQATAQIGQGRVAVTALRLSPLERLLNSSASEEAAAPITLVVPAPQGQGQGLGLQNLALKLPRAVFVGLPASSVPSDSLALTVAAFSLESSASLGSHLSTGESLTDQEVLSVISIHLGYMLSGESLEVSDLAEPIVFQLPGLTYDEAEALHCAFRQEQTQRWAFEGVRVRASLIPGQPFECETLHLSFFSALKPKGILQGSPENPGCARFSLSMEAMRNVFSDSSWSLSWGACLCWGALGLLFLALMAADHVDSVRDRSHQYQWRDEFFLVLGSKESESEGAGPLEEHTPQTSSSAACLRCMRSSSALPAALGEIVSSWLATWSQARNFCGTLVESLREGTGLHARNVTQRATAMLVMTSSRRLVAASLSMSNRLVTFVLIDEDLQEFLVEAQKCVSDVGTRALDWRTLTDQRVAWTSLHDTVVHHVMEHTERHRLSRLPRLWLELVLAHNPCRALFVSDIFRSCKKRVLLLAVDVLGAMAASCLLFSAFGLVDCYGAEGSLPWRLFRCAAIATGALLVSGLLLGCIDSMHTKGFRKVDYRGSPAWMRQLHVWAVQDAMVWTFALLYIAVCFSFVVVFLASIGPEDNAEWTIVGLMVLAEGFLLLPALLALCVPGMTAALLACSGTVLRMSRKEVLRTAHEAMLNRSNIMLPVMRV